mmetsp:Transcript_34291/g.80155  ORF Transcript_34291/g.80155 Transcript_34291/m.80155 type:complete len:119 (-) Transcript_34291:134-490(-)|eukprot:CAMPEP_0178404608 /NCGR_PEP_ID=MMETSP0689_2-20121128/17974_1 /TAXON_ID=160604 /ORGANISM="Amphidinium massartii, Strain CS-259" /LENGTH=118 /DNA_ID=CAMNT_0020025603 /DNA_START=145 /DNA_END=501 /DNA_ORIENTATION=-
MAEWNNGIFDCMGQPGGAGLCLITCFLPCMTLSEISEYLNPGSKSNVLMISGLLVFFGLGCVNCFLYDCPFRQQVAQKAGIEDPNAMLLVICCNCCHQIQVANHVKVMQGAPAQIEMS